MKNNKGFSLVELIIVIAIMAILVGVMAPQLIKYVEKTNAANDVQVCDSIRSAIQTAMLDPTVVMDQTYQVPQSGKFSALTGGSKFDDTLKDILGVKDFKEMSNQLKSSNAGGKLTGQDVIEVQIVNDNTVIVYIIDSDSTGEKCKKGGPNSIYSGVLRPTTGVFSTVNDPKPVAP